MWRSISISFIVLLWACSAQATPDLNTIDSVFALQDNESVILKGAYVERIAGSYVFVRNTWAGSRILPVYTSATVQRGWVLEITGHTATIGQRIVVAEQVKLYADSRGNPLTPMPYDYLIGYAQNLVDLTSQSRDTMMPADIPGPPASDPPGTPSVMTPAQGTIAWAKTLADGGDPITLTGKIITRNWTDYFYIEDDDRSCGIRVEKTGHGRVKGDRVDVAGTLVTNPNGERYINATSVTLNGSGTLAPCGMNNKSLGGGDFAYIAGPPASGQRGVTGASGPNNIGLLVRTWGKVTLDTANPPQYFTIDDGSGVYPRVDYPPYGYATNNYASITAISSCEVVNGNLQRVLRPQPLTCTIEQATGQNDPTKVSPVNFTVTFNEPISGFTADDVNISGTAPVPDRQWSRRSALMVCIIT